MQPTELTAMLADLVAIRSVNPLGRENRPASSPPVVDYLQRWCETQGLAFERQRVGTRDANLIVTVPGAPGGPSVLFDAHTDTVPADDWSDRAFQPRVDCGRLYGRGSCDTKASMVAMLTALRRYRDLPQEQRPATAQFVATADEEYGRTGVATFLKAGGRASFAIVGEPTRLVPVIACKGAARWQMTVSGRSAHSSTPRQGVNAIVRMARVIQVLEDYEQAILSAKRHPLVDPATLTVSVIAGGTAVNVVPAACTVSVDLRTMPDEDPGAAMQDAQRYLATRLDFNVHHDDVQLWGGADLPADAPLVRHVLGCCATAGRPGLDPMGVNYGCHASDYAGAGIPAVVLGPGDIAFAHAIDEYVELGCVQQAADIYYRIMTTPIQGNP